MRASDLVALPEVGRLQLQLLGNKSKHRRRRLFSFLQDPSREAQVTERDGEARWVRIAPPAVDQRQEILALTREIDVILVTELTRWGRSMPEVSHTLQDLQAWGVCVVAETGLQFDLRTVRGKLMASMVAALAEFEKDLLRERVSSVIAAAQKRCVVFGRRPGQRVKSDRVAPKVLQLVGAGQSYREISRRRGLSKNTLLGILKRDRAA